MYQVLDFVQQKKTKVTMEQPYMLPILYCQYCACWCPGNLRSQGISRHSIDCAMNNQVSSIRRVNTYRCHSSSVLLQVTKRNGGLIYDWNFKLKCSGKTISTKYLKVCRTYNLDEYHIKCWLIIFYANICIFIKYCAPTCFDMWCHLGSIHFSFYSDVTWVLSNHQQPDCSTACWD